MGYITNDAIISDNELYRYLLRRIWHHDKPVLLFIMLNPSTANGRIDDPTIKSCVRLAAALGFGGIMVVNLFAYRATEPNELWQARNPIGAENDKHIEKAIGGAHTIVCGWGRHKMARGRAKTVRDMAIRLGKPLHCFDINSDGTPKHPLYIKRGTQLIRWSGEDLGIGDNA